MKRLQAMLAAYKSGELDEKDLLEQLSGWGSVGAGMVRLDSARLERKGFPEVIYGPGKSMDRLQEILGAHDGGQPLVVSRLEADIAELLQRDFPRAEYHELARLLTIDAGTIQPPTIPGPVAVLCAGSADIPVAEEAAVFSEIIGYDTLRCYDVGVAGLHRLLSQAPSIQAAAGIIVIAGMDGALPSVVAGLFPAPVIAVPTSIGYGAHFGGIAPLLTMLNSCAPGISVVNIDNGLGAMLALHSMFHRLCPTNTQ